MNNVVELEKRVAALEKEVRELKQLMVCNKEVDWPAGLPLSEGRREVLDALCKEGFLRIENAEVHWYGKNYSTLALLCGVLWGGDRVRNGFWRKGNRTFPSAKLEKYFHVKYLKQKRNQEIGCQLSDEQLEVYAIISSYFGVK